MTPKRELKAEFFPFCWPASHPEALKGIQKKESLAASTGRDSLAKKFFGRDRNSVERTEEKLFAILDSLFCSRIAACGTEGGASRMSIAMEQSEMVKP